MSQAEQKVVQYLNEARASELALVSTLRAHIAMTPRGEYRTGLERHLGETRDHARRLQSRLRELGTSRSPLQAGIGLAQTLSGQALVFAKGPLDLARGFSPEEKMLKNAKDECATEALEIATYDALEALARAVKDEETAVLAASIRSDEERTLASLRAQIPKLTDAVVRRELRGQATYDPLTTGAAEAVQAGQAQATAAARQTRDAAEQTAAQTRQAAGQSAEQVRRAADQATGQARQAAGQTAAQARQAARATAEQVREATEQSARSARQGGSAGPPIEGYDSLNAGVVVSRLSGMSPDQVAAVDAYERAHKGRVSILRVTESRISRSE